LAQGPADSLAQEEVWVVGVRQDRRGEEEDVGPLLGVERQMIEVGVASKALSADDLGLIAIWCR
jgi:hypothetical protein